MQQWRLPIKNAKMSVNEICPRYKTICLLLRILTNVYILSKGRFAVIGKFIAITSSFFLISPHVFAF